MKIMVYSHDAFGLGNIRRMLAICQHLLRTLPKVSILVVSGSPALHSLQLPAGLDYIKLPCVGRDESGELAVKYLDAGMDETVKLRSDLILTTTASFKPDLLLVDKKPDGLQGELQDTLNYLRANCPKTKLVLLLRDILDRPETTIQQWQRHNYYNLIESLYDQVWVIGTPEIFDVRREYRFPRQVARKVQFCGYIHREPGLKPRPVLRQELAIHPAESLVLVTPGGGGDGFRLVKTYLSGLGCLPSDRKIRSLIVSGPEMPQSQREELCEIAETHPQVRVEEFTDDLIGYMEAADVVVSMGGHNTVSEILSLRKRAIVVPRVKPVEEQWIRAERMAKMRLFKMLHPDRLTPQQLMQTLLEELDMARNAVLSMPYLDMDALPRIADYLSELLHSSSRILATSYSEPRSAKLPLEATV